MANKKINELDFRTGVALTDLMLIGDPTSGTSFKLTATDFRTLLNLVPYTGATGAVNLGEFGLSAGQLTLDTSPTGTAAVGTTRWNDTIGSSETTLKGGSVILKNGVDLVARVVNKVSPNTTLTKAAYQAVRVSGAQGQRLAVAFAQANNDANSADTIGLVTETIATNQEGFIITVGQLENINTTGSLQGETWADGDVLYLSPFTPGAITKVKPTGNGHIVVIGYVEYAHANNGKIYVKVMNGWELDELHDVNIVSPANNEALIYESSTQLWKNKTIATALGYTPVTNARLINTTSPLVGGGDLSADRTISIPAATSLVSGHLTATDWNTFNNKVGGTGVSGQVAFWNGTNSQTGSANFVWDNATGRLSILSGVDNLLNLTPSSSGNAIVVNSNGYIKWENASLDTYIRGSNGFFILNNGFNTQVAFPFGTMSYINTGQNFAIGGSTDGGQRLQVYGTSLFTGYALFGSGNTGTPLATLADFRGGSDVDFIQVARASTSSDRYVRMYANGQIDALSTKTDSAPFTFAAAANANTSGTRGLFSLTNTFNPTSGTATYTTFQINQTINQTGGANGITRGLYVNPTLTAAADWRSIEWSNNSGWGLYGAGTSNNYLGGRLGIANTNPTNILDILVNQSSGDFVKIKNSSSTNTAQNGYTTYNNNNEGGGIFSYSSAFTNLTYRNNLGIVSTKGISIAADQLVESGGTSLIRFVVGGFASTPQMTLTAAGRLLLGTTTEGTFMLDVNGTARVSGASTFGGNMTLSLNQNAGTIMTISNVTDGTNSQAGLIVTSSNLSGSGYLAKYATSKTAFKVISPSDLYFLNDTAGHIVILNDFASGTIKMAAGGSSTAHFTIKANGRINMSSLPTSSAGLSAGDLWNDGGTLKIV